ncbi:MAG: hypothetical protein H0U49_06930 [Parachlamydiaceae bacterium]|nr:hypothetical protein [Parachlamydiaceae bacterium]
MGRKYLNRSPEGAAYEAVRPTHIGYTLTHQHSLKTKFGIKFIFLCSLRFFVPLRLKTGGGTPSRPLNLN